MASITCGNCKHTHNSVEDVRDCYAFGSKYVYDPGMEGLPSGSPLGQMTPTGGKFDSSPVSALGIYKLDDHYYKVQATRDRSDRLYAKQGVLEDGKWVWTYAKGAIYRLKSGHLLTAEQASEFGKLYNICVACFAELTHEESMDRGYGPVCAENNGWPYDHKRKG